MVFTRNEIGGTHLIFQNKRFQGFISEILRAVSLLGEKFIFFNSFGTTEISRILKLSVYFHVVLLKSFPEQFSVKNHSVPNIREVIKFYNILPHYVIENGENQHTFIRHSELAFPTARHIMVLSNKFDEPPCLTVSHLSLHH